MWFKTTQLKSSKQRLGGAMVDLGMSWTCILRRRSCFGGVKPLWASSLMNDDGDDDEEEEMTMAMTTTLFWFTMKRLLLTDSFQVFKLFHHLEQPMTQPFVESPPWLPKNVANVPRCRIKITAWPLCCWQLLVGWRPLEPQIWTFRGVNSLVRSNGSKAQEENRSCHFLLEDWKM